MLPPFTIKGGLQRFNVSTQKITLPISQILSANIVKFVLTNVCPESQTLILGMAEIHHYQNQKNTNDC